MKYFYMLLALCLISSCTVTEDARSKDSIISSGGIDTFTIKRKGLNCFDDIYAEIKMNLQNAGFNYDEVLNPFKDDPRICLAIKHLSDASQVRVLSFHKGTLSGWITYWIAYDSAIIEWEIKGINGNSIDESDSKAFEHFRSSLKDSK